MSQYKPYPTYKDSGVEWLGRVPSHWTVTKVGRTFAEPPCYGVLVPDFEMNGVPMLRITDMEHEHIDKSGLATISHELSAQYSRTIVQQGDVVLSVVGTIGKAFKISDRLAGINLSRAIARIQPSERVLASYLCRIFESAAFTRFVDLTCLGSAQRVLNMGDLSSFQFCIPVIYEQHSICNHIDRETARIDALIEKKTRFIELLREKRQALITHAVTKGLNPNAKMKDSGVEWLGKVPEHWSFGRLAYVCDLIVDGTHHSPESHPEGEYKYITAKNIKEHGFDFTELTYITAKQHREIYSRCSVKPGDVLYIKDGATAGIAMVTDLDEEFSLLSSVAVIRPKKGKLLPLYLKYVLNSEGLKSSVLSQLVGGAITRFTLEMISNFSVPLPNFEEQKQIVNRLEESAPRMDRLIKKTEHSITLLKERRSALITAAVTGQIDLREAS